MHPFIRKRWNILLFLYLFLSLLDKSLVWERDTSWAVSSKSCGAAIKLQPFLLPTCLAFLQCEETSSFRFVLTVT